MFKIPANTFSIIFKKLQIAVENEANFGPKLGKEIYLYNEILFAVNFSIITKRIYYLFNQSLLSIFLEK